MGDGTKPHPAGKTRERYLLQQSDAYSNTRVGPGDVHGGMLILASAREIRMFSALQAMLG